MATPTTNPHDRTRRLPADDEEDDPVEKMLKRSGCIELHYAVQECMAEMKDWRQCQDKVKEFRKCIEKSMLQNGPQQAKT